MAAGADPEGEIMGCKDEDLPFDQWAAMQIQNIAKGQKHREESRRQEPRFTKAYHRQEIMAEYPDAVDLAKRQKMALVEKVEGVHYVLWLGDGKKMQFWPTTGACCKGDYGKINISPWKPGRRWTLCGFIAAAEEIWRLALPMATKSRKRRERKRRQNRPEKYNPSEPINAEFRAMISESPF